MKVLIVDDDLDRSAKLVASLEARFGSNVLEVETKTDGDSARHALESVQYDLLVLDVLLPARAGGELSEQAALSILVEISETSRLLKPRHIIGLTAFDVAEENFASEFTDRSWVLVRQYPYNDDWLRTIGSAVQYIREQDAAEDEPRFDVDVVVVTALQLEMDAVKRLPWKWGAEQALDDCQFFARGAIETQGRQHSVVAAVCARMGMVSASVLASKLIHRFRPRLVVMPGICAGIRDKVELGDVVCADMSWDYQSGKHVLDRDAIGEFLMDPHFIQADPVVTARMDQLARDDDLAVAVWRDWTPRAKAPPVLRRGPMASGSAVLADASAVERIKAQQRKTLAVEMEAYGVFYAVEQAARPRPLVVAMKGVCDFADESKSDDAQPYAAYTSARFLEAFCERYLDGLR